ncbi:DUF1453 domain-containing protein [Amycolatopsis minnesotensis]|uniref:DUF1453 domain-containing protein n=1 Tax=Amycolatopsis minnesotensis TaxID=337894 RepID=A0ABN2QYX4_9PSEU
MPSVFWLVVVGVLVVVLVVKRFRGGPLTARDAFVSPVVLLGIGAYELTKVPEFSGLDIGWLVLGTVVGLVFGGLRGTTTLLSERDGGLWQRYTKWTVAVWLIASASSFGLGVLGVALGAHEEARPIVLSVGISLIGEAAVVGFRAKALGVRFAPEPARRRWV